MWWNEAFRDDDGRKLDHETLEAMRLRAVQAVENGQHPDEVAVSLGTAWGTVYMWLAKYREGGKAALAAKPVPGRHRSFRPPSYSRSTGWWWAGTRKYSFDFALWTRGIVRQLIRECFGVALSEVSVGRLLRKLGLSP